MTETIAPVRTEPPQFEQIAKLGVGGMADVFLGRVVDGSNVAIKRLRVPREDMPEARRLFRRESQIAALLKHPSIVHFEGAGEDEHGLYLLFEYVDGPTLSALIKAVTKSNAVMPLNFARMLAYDMASALAYAHALEHARGVGIIHRDISPDNFLISSNGRCKLSDFGIATLADYTRLTKTGAVRGKVAYVAPELFDGKTPSAQSDIFALAATLFQLFTGVAAFRGRTENELLAAVMMSTPTPIQTLRPDLAPPLAVWISKALQRDPVLRPSASELVALLDAPTDAERQTLGEWVTALCPPLDSPLRVPKPAPKDRVQVDPVLPPRRSSVVWLWTTLGLLLVAVVGTTMALGSRESSTAIKDGMQTSASPSSDAERPVEPKVAAVKDEGSPRVVDTRPSFLPQEKKEAPSVSPPSVAERARLRVRSENVKPKKPANRKSSTLPTIQAPRESRVAQISGSSSPTVPANTYLEIRVNPYGQVFLDGDLKGMTPLGAIEVRPGIHTVLVLPSGDNPQLKRKTVRAEAVEGVTTRVTVDLTTP